jgi:hypothetical protein
MLALTAAQLRVAVSESDEAADGAQHQIAEVSEVLLARSDELAIRLARTITREVRPYRSAPPVPFDVVAECCKAHARSLFEAIASGMQCDPTPATDVGIELARDGVPLASLMEAYRVGFRDMWDAIAAEAAIRIHLNCEVLRILTEKTLAAQDIYIAAMTMAFKEEERRLLRADKYDHSVLIDSLLHGRLFEQWSVWEAADYLRLPSGGPFVVIAAEVEGVGSQALPQIESKLRSADLHSAWRLLPDLHVGIVHVKTDKHFAEVLALVSRMAKNRVGISPRFDDLRETAQALRYARVLLRGRFDPEHLVTLFDGSILGCAAVSAPEVMVKLATPIIDCFGDLADNEREILFDTFRVWLDTDASMRAVGKALFCHPNTVRYRLNRIEERTGRSFSRPRDVAELCLAFEVNRRLM